MSKNITGVCRICGKNKKLTEEHSPPKSAFNSGRLLLHSLDPYKTKKVSVWRTKIKQAGYSAPVQCEDCNNKIGQWYGVEYKKFTEHCSTFANTSNAEQSITIKIPSLFPLRVFKQVLTIICSTSDDSLSSKWLGVGDEIKGLNLDISVARNSLTLIRKFILDKEAKGLPVTFRLYAYLVANRKGRKTGIIPMFSKSKNTYALFTEFSWFPLGWILAFDGNIEDKLLGSIENKLLDITDWSKYKYDEEVAIDIEIPCYWVESKSPLDFRSPSQMKEVRAINQAKFDKMFLKND